MLIPRVASVVTSHASKTRGAYALNGVLIERTATGPRVVAGDGHRLIAVTWTEPDAAEYPEKPVDLAPRSTTRTIIPTKDFEAACKAAPKSHRPILNVVALEESSVNGTVRLFSTDLDADRDVTVRTVEGEYPDVDQVIPPAGRAKVTRVAFNPSYMIETCKALLAVSDRGNVAVTLEIDGPDRPMKLTAKNADGVEAVAVIMPMSLD